MYQVIARKYRPQTFAEIIGQEHVRATLENAITHRRIAHGYILAGQRGTGKTTIARILARCLNCVDGPTAVPCGVCSSCLEIAQGNAPDVIEIDAASNRGINEMRELRENVRYRPARDRYKIFIIDEAHQITNEAFNALLKTLEEPPEWAVFVLCTTESHKIPTTIGSRCQQFSFRSVDFNLLVERMRYICAQEGVEADEEALAVLAQAGEGSVRDSLSALDQAIACCGAQLDGSAVRDLLGLYSIESLQQVANALAASDTSAMLAVVSELESQGKNLQHFCRELSRYFRNLLVSKIAGAQGPTRLIAASDNEQARLRETAARFSEEDLTRWLQITLEIYGQLQYSLQPRFHLELGLLRLVHAGRMQPIEEALKELKSNAPPPPAPARSAAAPTGRPAYTMAAPAPKPPAPRTGPSPFEASRNRPPAPPSATAPSAPSAPAAPAAAPAPGELKQRLIAELEAMNSRFSLDAVRQSEIVEGPGVVEFIAPGDLALSLRAPDVEKALQVAAGRAVRTKITLTEAPSAPAPSPSSSQSSEEAEQRALAHPDVQKFRELFPGSRVRDVRNLKE